ncbi:MAG TPA: hypothetical protein VFO69_06585 [Allosphingosinicella sp.]|nr:hypothetical protein [Allosphingosinicella sp.]
MQQPPSQSSGGTSSELRSDAQHLGSTAANRLHSEVDSRKGDAAQQAKSVSSAIQRAAGDLGEDSPDWLRSAFRKGAEQVQRFADTLEQKDSRQLVGEIESFGRERPGSFLLGCAAAGFAAARVLKAGGEPTGTDTIRSRESEGSRQNFSPDDARPFPTAQRDPGFVTVPQESHYDTP